MNKDWVCPKCRQSAVVPPRHYADGERLYIHEQRVEERPFPHVIIVRSCSVLPAHN